MQRSSPENLVTDQSGQSASFMVLFLLSLVLAVGVSVDTAGAVLTKIRLQNAADAAAQAGAAMLADGLNAIAISNDAMLLLLGASLVNPSALRAVRGIQKAQDTLESASPVLSLAAAEIVATRSKAAAVVLSSPSLMVTRVRLRGVPLWMSDAYESSPQKPYGDRSVAVSVTPLRKEASFLRGLRAFPHPSDNGLAVAEAAAMGGRLTGGPRWAPMVYPSYKSRLVPFSRLSKLIRH
ncbi:MAG: hypothetical protein HYY08_00440 [Firmicutes bacterium]|nr:hypothetical protein [Bacillota bacterium]